MPSINCYVAHHSISLFFSQEKENSSYKEVLRFPLQQVASRMIAIIDEGLIEHFMQYSELG